MGIGRLCEQIGGSFVTKETKKRNLRLIGFSKYDSDKNGEVPKAELDAYCKKNGIKGKEKAKIEKDFNKVSNNDGHLSWRDSKKEVHRLQCELAARRISIKTIISQHDKSVASTNISKIRLLNELFTYNGKKIDRYNFHYHYARSLVKREGTAITHGIYSFDVANKRISKGSHYYYLPSKEATGIMNEMKRSLSDNFDKYNVVPIGMSALSKYELSVLKEKIFILLK